MHFTRSSPRSESIGFVQRLGDYDVDELVAEPERVAMLAPLEMEQMVPGNLQGPGQKIAVRLEAVKLLPQGGSCLLRASPHYQPG